MKPKPVLTIRMGSAEVPTVKIGKMDAKHTAYPAEYITTYRAGLKRTNVKTVCNCGQTILQPNPKNLCETCWWKQEGPA